MTRKGPELQKLVLETLKTCSDLVGATLGPGGQSVVIEHQEVGLPPTITKDGVTVFRALGFDNASAHVLMEAARDASIRTASEAGDGTTTATILAESIVRHTIAFTNKNPHISPQRVVRVLQDAYSKAILPMMESAKVQPDLLDDKGRKMCHSVAKISANGDVPLADAVMKCFDIIGSEGNVTIVEATGPSKYEVQKIEGYPVQIGYEDCCGPFYPKFINDPGTQTCVLEKPSFVLYNGRISDFNSLFILLNQIAEAMSAEIEKGGALAIGGQKLTHNVVVVATGFSETVLANLGANFVLKGTLNVVPLVAPMTPMKNGQLDFIQDIAALTGGTIMDLINTPLQNFKVDFLGVGVKSFEMTRFRTNIIGYRDELLVFERVDQITKREQDPSNSEMEKRLLRERIAKMTSGIAKLIVYGSSNGEVKERRDRAEDAVCAVRGALANGALYGGGFFLKVVSDEFASWGNCGSAAFSEKYGWWPNIEEMIIVSNVLAPALLEPIKRLFTNAGYTEDEMKKVTVDLDKGMVFDLMERRTVPAFEENSYLLDSLPAVRDAIKNSISIASLLGTCGGTVVFKRDHGLEVAEARDTAEFVRNANVNEANERG